MKGINPVEEHFEKALVGLLVLGLAGVIVWQLLLAGNTVEVGGQELPLGQAYAPAERAANSLKASLEEPNPTLPEVDGLDALAALEASLGGGRGGEEVATLPAFGSSISIAGGGTDVRGGAGRTYAAFEPPVPSGLVGASRRVTLDPVAVAETEGLSSYVPSAQPFDVLAVSVQGVFSGEDLRALLEQDPDGDGPLDALPRSYWFGRTAVLGVEFERERQLADGTWGEAEMVAPSPGGASFIESGQGMLNAGDIAEVTGEASRDAALVLTPAFPGVIAGDPWVPPSEVEAIPTDPSAREVLRLRRSLRALRSERERLEGELDARQSLDEARRERLNEQGGDGLDGGRGRTGRDGDDGGGRRAGGEDTGDRGGSQPSGGRGARGGDAGGRGGEGGAGGRGARGGGAGGRGGGGGGGDEDRVTTGRDPSDPFTGLQRRIEQLDERIASQASRLEDLVGKVEEEVLGKGVEDFVLRGEVLDAEDVHFWAHDFDVDGGERYRYRARLVLANPLFGRDEVLSEEQKGLAASKLVRSAFSGWSEPVETSDSQYFFVSAANPGNEVAPASATLEVFGFYYGFWRQGEVTVRPGDALRVSAPLPEGLQVFPGAGEESDREPVDLPDEYEFRLSSWLADVVRSPLLPPEGRLVVRNADSVEVIFASSDGGLDVFSPVSGEPSARRLALLDSVESGLGQEPLRPGASGTRGRTDGLDRDFEDGGEGGGRFPIGGRRAQPGRGGG